MYMLTTVALLLESAPAGLRLLLLRSLQSSPLSLRREAMQQLLIQLLQQLQGSQTTDDPRLQRMLLFGCCECLHSLHLQSAAPDYVSPTQLFLTTDVAVAVMAVAPALCDWMVDVEAAGPDWEPAGLKLGQFFLLPAMFRRDYDGLLHTLICTAAAYLDSQEKWKELQAVQHGLHDLLHHLGACMWATAKSVLEEHEEDNTRAMAEVESYFEILSTASKHQAVTVTTSDAVPASASDPHATDRDMLLQLWRTVAFAAVMLLCLFCREAYHLQRQYKQSRQVVTQRIIYL
ncbi:hypothetical protein ABBQ38_011916 [Trebouxia sp. C0009 RCD-2024]